jgi:ABC-type nitrate/sulfonate/bicarbonate transport system substrate-binding protein
MMGKIKIAVLASVLLLVVIGGYLWQASFRAQPIKPYSGPVEKIALSTLANSTSGLILIAHANGYFKDIGLEVTLKLFPTGSEGLKQLQAGQIDVTHVSDFVLVKEIFMGASSLRCLGSIAATDIMQVIAMKDRGILQPGDLKGKKIGVTRATIAEFYLGQFLSFHNLVWQDVEVVNLNPGDLPEALANGKIEALMVWEPYIYEIKKRLGDKVISWPGQNGQQFYNILVSSDQYTKAKPEALVRLFRALERAEAFVKQNNNQALKIVAQQLKVDASVLKDEWISSTYELSLDQSLLITMEDKARWMTNNKLTDQSRVPYFLDYIYAEPLAKADPQAVRIIIPKDARAVAPAPAGTGQERR